jgi:hypothetical protein
MGKPLMIQPEDDVRIEALKERLGTKTKVDVVRAGLRLLEQEADRLERIQRWKKAAALAQKSSEQVNVEFQRHSRLKRK